MPCRLLAAMVLPFCFCIVSRAACAGDAAPPIIDGRPAAALCCGATPATFVRNNESLLAWLLVGAPLAESSQEAGVARTAAAENAHRTEELLQQWANASNDIEPMTDARLRRLAQAGGSQRNGHEVVILAMLQRPVTVAELTHRFEWTLEAGTKSAEVLAAAPRDPVERLFVPRILVRLHRDSGLPESVRFSDRTGRFPSSEIALAMPKRLPTEEPVSEPAILQTAALKTETITPRPEPTVLTSTQRQASELVARRGGPEYSAAATELSQILVGWERATRWLGPQEIQLTRYQYDRVFNIERRAAGRLFLGDETHIRFEVEPAIIAVGDTSRRTDAATGKPFRLEADRADLWIWNGRQVTHANPADRMIWEWKIPETAALRPASLWGDFRVERAVPFLHPVRAADLEQRFDITIERRTESHVTLVLRPRSTDDAVNGREYQVILSADSLLPEAVQMVESSGNIETVYKVNRRIARVLIPQELFAPRWDNWRRSDR